MTFVRREVISKRSDRGMNDRPRSAVVAFWGESS